MLLRLLKIIRLLRLVKGLGALQQYFENLHLMVRGIQAAAPVLLWVVVLVYPMLACFALFMIFTLQEFIENPMNPEEDRLTCYGYFGTFSRATLSMFECTFGNWVPICRFLHSKIDEKFAIIIMAWKLVVGIAVLRIIYGVFLHVTFACANADDEDVVNQRLREEKQYEKKMQTFFKKFDGGTGYLTRPRFLEVLEHPKTRTWLSGFLDLEIHDAELLYDLVDDCHGDDHITVERLVHGFWKVKGLARSVDMLALTRITSETLKKLDALIVRTGTARQSHLASLAVRPAHEDLEIPGVFGECYTDQLKHLVHNQVEKRFNHHEHESYTDQLRHAVHDHSSLGR
jgi:hypothetical protein